MISVGPVCVGYSSPEEIRTYLANANSSRALDEVSSIDEDKEDAPERLDSSAVEFAPTYPCKPSYSTVTLHNYRYVNATTSFVYMYMYFTVNVCEEPEVCRETSLEIKTTSVWKGRHLSDPAILG